MLGSPDPPLIQSFSSLSWAANIVVSSDVATLLDEIYGADSSLVDVPKILGPTTVWLSCSPRSESMSRLQVMQEIKITVLTRSCNEYLTALSKLLTFGPLVVYIATPKIGCFSFSMATEDWLAHFFMLCRWNRDCEYAKNHYVVCRSPVIIVNDICWMQARWPNWLGEESTENGCGYRILSQKVYLHAEEDQGNKFGWGSDD